MNLCFDVCWAYRGGIDPLALIREYPARIRSLHLRNSVDGVLSEALSRSTRWGLAAYHRAAFRLQKTPVQVLTGFSRVPISRWVDDVIFGIGTAGVLAKRLVGAPPGSLREAFFQLGREWFEVAYLANTRLVPQYTTVYKYGRAYVLPGGRLVGWLAHSGFRYVLDWGFNVGIDVGVQALLDAGNPYLTSEQRTERLLWAAVGSTACWGVALLIPGPGWVMFLVGVGANVVWDVWITPVIYERRGLEGKLRLRPLS